MCSVQSTLAPKSQRTISIPLMQMMAKKRALDAEDRHMKRKADEIHPCKGKDPFEIMREYLRHFQEPPAFHPKDKDDEMGSTVDIAVSTIQVTVDYLDDLVSAMDGLLDGDCLMGAEKCSLGAQRKFTVDMSTCMSLLIQGDSSATEAWSLLKQSEATIVRRQDEFDRQSKLDEADEAELFDLKDLIISAVSRRDESKERYRLAHCKYLVSTLPAVSSSKLARTRKGDKYCDIRKKVQAAQQIVNLVVLAKICEDADCIKQGIIKKLIDGAWLAYCQPCNKVFKQTLKASVVEHCLGKKATGSKLRIPPKQHTQKWSAWSKRQAKVDEVSAVVVTMLEAKVKSIPTNETHAKEMLDVLMLDADFKVLMLADPVEIPSVFISTREGTDHGYQTMQFRAQLVRNQMRSGVPRNSLENQRSFTERWVKDSLKSTSQKHLSLFVPGVHLMELVTLFFEFQGCNVWFIYDGATVHGTEILSLVLRKCTDFKVAQRCVDLSCYEYSFSGQTLMVAIDTNFGKIRIPVMNVLGGTHDMCAANVKCQRMMVNTAGYENCFDGPCLSHPTDGTVGYLTHLHLDLYWSPLVSLQGCSRAANNTYYIHFKKSWDSYSSTRWGSETISLNGMRDGIKLDDGAIPAPFPRGIQTGSCPAIDWAESMVLNGVGDKTASLLLQLLKSPASGYFIEMELAARCITGMVLHIACTCLEGDNLGDDQQDLIFAAHRHLERIRIHFQPDEVYAGNADMLEIASRAVVWANSPDAEAEINAAEAAYQVAAAAHDASEAAARAADAAVLDDGGVDEPPPQRVRRAAADNSAIGQRAAARANQSQDERAAKLKKAGDAAVEKSKRNEQKEKEKEKKAEAERKAPPKTIEGWMKVGEKVVVKARSYSQKLIGKPNGDLDDCEMKPMMKVCESCDMLNPSVAATTDKPRAMELLENLARYLPFVSTEEVTMMKAGWDDFKVLAVGVAAKQDVLGFFKLHQEKLPTFGKVVQNLALIPSSSAACERVFSLLRNMFGPQAFAALEDYRSAAVKLAYNHRST